MRWDSLYAATAFLLVACSAGAQNAANTIAPATAITLTSPLDYQVFQRSSQLKGSVFIRGQAKNAAGPCRNARGSAIDGQLARWAASGCLGSPEDGQHFGQFFRRNQNRPRRVLSM
jgi:hypothetical protein